ncbi:MAG: apolipoprotein N-acyltransferase [Spirochaetes bacterium]|nr:apolipoprotein N-acyltransferase [Spirochaetota bacterium]
MKRTTIYLNYIEVILLSLFGGIAMAFAFPMQSRFYLAFIAFVPMAIIVFTCNKKKIILASAIYVSAFFGLILYWVAAYMLKETPLPIAILAFLLILITYALYYSLAGVLISLIASRKPLFRVFLLAAGFTLLDYFRTLGFLGFPWGIAGYSQWNFLPMIQVSDITGVYGVSFVIYLVNAVIADTFIKYRDKTFDWKSYLRFPAVLLNQYTASVVILAAVFVYGGMKLSQAKQEDASQPKQIPVALVQENFDFNYRWNEPSSTNLAKGKFLFMDPGKLRNTETNVGRLMNGTVVSERIIRLAKEGALKNPSLIVFSESATLDYYDFFLPEVKRYRTDVNRIREVRKKLNDGNAGPYNMYNTYILHQGFYDIGRYVVLGAPLLEPGAKGRFKFFNGVLLIDKTGDVVKRYAKRRMVPFGEAYPFYDNEWMKKTPPFSFVINFIYKTMESAGAGNWAPWHEYTVFTHPEDGYRFSVSVCFEDAFGELMREFTRGGAEVLFNISNDAWSYSDASEWEHFTISLFRAVENRRDMLRATDCGVTGAIDAYGRVKATIPLWREGYLSTSFTKRSGMTFYTAYGNIFLIIIASLFGIIVIVHAGGILIGFLKRKFLRA